MDDDSDLRRRRSAYVYLKNRTFLNAHLVRSGFVHVELKNPYQYRLKFTQLYMEARGKR